MARGSGKKKATQKKKSVRRNAANAAADRWLSLKLDRSDTERSDLLSPGQLDDSTDSSRLLIRHSRFSPSYMMATNGGATYETVLRSAPSPVETIRPEAAALGRRDGPRGDGLLLQNVLGGIDERRHISDTSAIPARSVGLLKILPDAGGHRYGTAWLIGPRTLATAAHNLLHPQAGAARQVSVGLAYDGNTARGGWHRIEDCRFPVEWQNNPEEGSPFDFAVLRIADPQIGRSLGWFGFADYENAKFESLILNIFGYPLDLGRFHLYGVAGRVVDFDEWHIYYDCDTGGGMSGAPVIARFGEQRIAVGVHIAGGTLRNVATRINDAAHALFQQHKEW
jgi:V8-like Glu-specific endopeptidase